MTRRRNAIAATLTVLALGGGTVFALSSDGAEGASTSGVSTAAAEVADGTGIWDADALHDISVEVEEEAMAAMIDSYQETGDKDWIEARVTIDGTTFERVGLRLKGNSSLHGVTDDADPADLPWLLRLDEYVDGQALDGWTDFVVRSNSSETALNEAVALDLLAEAGLASEHTIATSFAVNGGDAQLRLVVQALDEAWEDETFTTDGLLYKSEAGGDWTYRGTDPDSYTDIFDQETGDDDLTPLIQFLDFLNNSTDEELEAELASKLDVEAFARYLAFEDLVGNDDDIDGPGNNSYLRYDAETGGFTVVAWDHNLAFGGMGRMGGPGGSGGFGERPEGMSGGMRGGPGGSNVLVERFTAVEEWADLVEQARADLTESLYASGFADESIDRWADLLTTQASDLVDADTVAEEAGAVRDVVASKVE